MTQFKDLEMLYKNFVKLTDEINSLIKNEDYILAAEKVEHKSKLIKQLSQAKRTTELTTEQSQKLESIENEMREDYKSNLSTLEVLQEELGVELRKTKKKFKLNNVYTVKDNSSSGGLVDFTE